MSIKAFAPGRVNLIGEHTDYNAGLALPFAIEQGVTVTASALSERTVRVTSTASGERDEFDPVAVENINGWRAFVRGVVYELASDGVDVRGAQITIDSDLPQGVGLSSSAALTVALALALTELAGAERPEPGRLARLCQRVECDWVGAQTGLLDQLAVITAEAGHATLIDFEDLSTVPVGMEPHGHTIVIADSGEHHSNASSGYNTRRQESQEAAYRMRLETLRGATITDLHMLPDELVGRARHVISENGRVLNAVQALRVGDMDKLGMLLNQSHASLRDEFEVSTPTVDALVNRLLAAGAIGARIVGGGFGGSVIALMPPGAEPPAGAQTVIPSQGARLL